MIVVDCVGNSSTSIISLEAVNYKIMSFSSFP